jgi:predicted GIY-YIG superfamily endonuclease
MVFIYILELENKKYYVGKTTDPNFRIDSHFNSNGSTNKNFSSFYLATRSAYASPKKVFL